jgi:hypothetical protein
MINKLKVLPFIFGLLFLAAFVLLGVSIRRSPLFTCCGNPVFQNGFETGSKTAVFEGKTINIPQLVYEDTQDLKQYNVLGISSDEKWIEIDLSEQKLRAWEGSTLFLETLVSTGLPYFPTPQGEFRIWAKIRATRMEGGTGKYYYNLPNVPFVMFFENSKVPGYRGYGLHGTYWHNDFGKVHSHGCVNLPTPIAEKLYYWTTPIMPEGKFYIRSSAENPGTRIIIHE